MGDIFLKLWHTQQLSDGRFEAPSLDFPKKAGAFKAPGDTIPYGVYICSGSCKAPGLRYRALSMFVKFYAFLTNSMLSLWLDSIIPSVSNRRYLWNLQHKSMTLNFFTWLVGIDGRDGIGLWLKFLEYHLANMFDNNLFYYKLQSALLRLRIKVG